MSGHLGLPTTYAGCTFEEVLSLLDQAASRGVGSEFDERFSAAARFGDLEGKLLASGNGASIFQEWAFRVWWIWRANQVGADQANAELEAYLAADEVEVVHLLTLYGVTTDKARQLTRNVRLLPLSDIPFSRYAFWLSAQERLIFPPQGGAKPSAVLALNLRTPKVAPLEVGGSSEFFDAQREMHEVAILLNALPGVCSYPAAQLAFLQDWVPPGCLQGEGASAGLSDVAIRATTAFKEPEGTTVQALFDAFHAKPEAERHRLTMALFRLGQAKGRNDPNDRALDVGIALEMLLLNESPPDQLSLTFRLRGAWLLGKTLAERRRIHDVLKEIYSLRSKVAHGGFAKTLRGPDASRLASERVIRETVAEDVVRHLILSDRPDWTALVLGARITD